MTIVLYRDDCLNILSTLETNSIDLIFADPPYNIGKRYGGTSRNDKRDDYYIWCDKWIVECFRVLRDTGTFYLKTIDRHLEKKFPLMGSYGFFISLVKWKNVSASHSKRRFWNSSEPILMYGKTDKYIFNTYAQTREVAKPSWNKERRARQRGQLLDWWDDIKYVYSGSVCHPEAILGGDGSKRKVHPCQMPIALPLRAILFSTVENQTVLDPFMGLGATGIACKKTNRNFIGIEIDNVYFEIAKNRIEAEA